MAKGSGRSPACDTLQCFLLWLVKGALALIVSFVAASQASHGAATSASKGGAHADPASVVKPLPSVGKQLISFETTEGTFISLDVSSDGKTLVFDLLGDIYGLPVGGGKAVPLTSGREWDQAPRFSPDGKFIYFVSDRKGTKNIWRLMLSDRSVHQVTASATDIMGTPNWSQNGARLIAGLGDATNAEIVLNAVDPDNGEMTALERADGSWIDRDTFTRLRPRIRTASGVQAANGELYFSEPQFDLELGHTVVKLYGFDPDTQKRTAFTAPDASYHEYKPQLSHDGRLLAYFRQYDDRRTEIRITNRSTGKDESLLELSDADDASFNSSVESQPNYSFTPDDRQLILSHGGKIHQVSLADGAVEGIPFRVKVDREVWTRALPAVEQLTAIGEARIIRWPSVSRDGQTMAFAAIGYVWVVDLKSGAVRRVTHSSDFEYMPAISPNGTSIAYISFAHTETGYGPGRLMIAEVDHGTQRELLAGPNETYLLPKWSPDGQKVAVIRERGRKGEVDAAFGWTPVVRGTFNDVAPAPSSNERLSAFLYARFVGFDDTGNNLLFSFRRTRAESDLAMATLDGRSRGTLATGTSEVAGIAPAPDLKNLALTRHDGTVWVVPFIATLRQGRVSTASPDARRVSNSGGYYVDWSHTTQFTFAFGRDVYRYVVDGNRSEAVPIQVPFAKIDAAPPVAFTGARLITLSDDSGAGPVIEPGAIVLRDQRIVAVGSLNEVTIPSDALVIDATGQTIMPGLLDTHYHRIGGDSLSAFALPNAKFSDRSAIAYGITSAWEPGGPVNDGAPAIVDLQMAGRISGPRWVHSAMGAVGYPWEQLTSYAAAVAAVEQHRLLGVDVLKEYNTPTRRQRQWLAVAAHKNGLGIVSHIESFDGMMTRIIDGYTGGDHPYIPAPFYKDVRELFKQTGYIWTPNVIITSGSSGSWKDVKNYFWREILKNRPWELKKLKAVMPSYDVQSIIERQSPPYHTHRVARVAEQVATAAKDGVHIGVSAHGMPGVNLHAEMWFLWKGGMPVGDVLRAATIGNAEKLGLQEEVGSLEVGKMADFQVLDANPLDDILNTLSLKYTVQGGVVYDSATAQRVDLSALPQRPNEATVH